MRAALVALLLCGCRTQPFAFGDMATTTKKITDQTYDAHLLATDDLRVGIYERSPEGAFCAIVVLVNDRNMTQGFTTPPGFSAEHEFFLPYRDDCFAVDPFTDPAAWGAEALGSVTFNATLNDIPCSLNIHAHAASHLTEQGVTRPGNIVADVDFDRDNLVVDNACRDD